MEEKNTTNVSSGAKKVESLEKPAGGVKKTATKTTAKKSTAKTSQAVKKAANRAKQAEAVAAEKRLDAAKAHAAKKEQKYLHKAEAQQKKLEKKAELKEKKLEKRAALAAKKAERKQARLDHLAEAKQRKVEHKAERIARREMLKNETKAERQKRLEREKKERIALKRRASEQKEKAREQKMKAREAAHARKAEERKHKREQKTERKKHAPGFGGWLAAVISLGVTCLALATVVTAGAFRMNDMATESVGGYRSTLFEMVSVSEEMDNNLSKLRVASGAEEQRRLLTDLLVDAALMENAMEKIPVDTVTGTDISAFINKTGSYCRNLLSKLATGSALTQTERNTLDYLYTVNSGLYNELNELATHMTEKEFRAFLDGKEGEISQKFGEMGQGTLTQPQETVDAPFSGEGNVGTNQLEGEEEISRTRAEELVKEYLKDYHVSTVMYTGETVSKEAQCYNFSLTDANGIELYAQITKKGGKLAFFNTYEACTEKNFDLNTCDSLAREFLASLGIEEVEAVWLTDTGMVADIAYVGVQNGVRVYPDMIKVRVCESKGRVVGMDAVEYLLNHEERSFGSAITREEAQEKLSAGLEPYAAHLALVPIDGKEILAHEFACTYGEEEYIVYLDANTGDEIQVYRVRNSANGSYLR